MKKHLMTDEFTQLLKRKKLVVVLVDCTKADSIGAQEMKRGGVHTQSVPALSMIHRDGMVTYAKLDLTSKKTLKRTVAAIIRKAEQVDADQPATAVELKSEGRKKVKPESEGRSQ